MKTYVPPAPGIFRLLLPSVLLLAVSVLGMAPVDSDTDPERKATFVFENESGEQYQTGPMIASNAFTIELPTPQAATLSVYTMDGTLMARRVIRHREKRKSMYVPVNRWERSTFLLVVKTRGQEEKYTLKLE